MRVSRILSNPVTNVIITTLVMLAVYVRAVSTYIYTLYFICIFKGESLYSSFIRDSEYQYFLVMIPSITVHPSSQSADLTQTATFTCSATGYNVSYQWTIGSGSFPNDRVTGINTNNLTITDVRSSDDNTYTCVVSNRGGSVSSNAAQLTVTGMTMMIV